jgi:hypothetical protein
MGYRALIAPFRHWVVYLALMPQIGRGDAVPGTADSVGIGRQQ